MAEAISRTGAVPLAQAFSSARASLFAKEASPWLAAFPVPPPLDGSTSFFASAPASTALVSAPACAVLASMSALAWTFAPAPAPVSTSACRSGMLATSRTGGEAAAAAVAAPPPPRLGAVLEAAGRSARGLARCFGSMTRLASLADLATGFSVSLAGGSASLTRGFAG